MNASWKSYNQLQRKRELEYMNRVAEMVGTGIARGDLPWQRTFEPSQMVPPMNPSTGTVYKDTNILYHLLAKKTDHRYGVWATLKNHGFYLKKGSKTVPIMRIVNKKLIEQFDEQTGHSTKRWIKLKKPEIEYFYCANYGDLVNPPDAHKVTVETRGHDFEQFLAQTGARVEISQDQQGYDVESDIIFVKPRDSYRDDRSYFSQVSRSLCRWAAAEGRLNTGLDTYLDSKEAYAAQITRERAAALLLCHEYGLGWDPDPSDVNRVVELEVLLKSAIERPQSILKIMQDAIATKGYLKALTIQRDQSRENQVDPEQER
jgi:antirestriction protein ArdC